MIIGLLVLVASQVMFMEAHSYWLLCLARVMQGIRFVYRPHPLNPLTGRIVQQLCGLSPLHYCRCNIAHLYIRPLRMVHRCDTVPEELVGRGSKFQSCTRAQLITYAGQLGLAMIGFSIGYIRDYSSRQTSPEQSLVRPLALPSAVFCSRS